jgi:hypothetical protein
VQPIGMKPLSHICGGLLFAVVKDFASSTDRNFNALLR